MKNALLALFDDRLRKTAAERFGLDPSSLKMLTGFENVVMEASRDGTPCILRISHNSHRSLAQVQAELHWIDYLSGHGVSVCTPIRSLSGSLTESLEAGGEGFVAVVLQKAPGAFVLKKDQTPAMAFNRGKLLGRMHALTKTYQPPSDMERRSVWYEEDDFVNYRRYLPPGDEIVGDRFDELLAELRALPVDKDSWGLIHMDPHTGNIFFDGDRPTIFDFDDCAYDFFISDIAISLFYATLMFPKEGDRKTHGRDFLDKLLEGYRTENRLDNRWRDVIPLVLKRREIILYVAIYRGFDQEDFDDWCRTYLDGRREMIRDRVPYLDLDWSRFDLGK